ncbi:MAG: kelch motif-containing protein, partial [Thermoplasmata archaeon]|nr:kelch motif-containing protein [Thermoplasmata archaeon]
MNLTNSVSQSPGAEYIASMAYDTHDGYVLMFGGSSGSGVSASTWTYQNGVWTDISGNLNSSPPKRYAAAMTYDAKDNETVLFGGYDASAHYWSDTWTFANGTWTNLTSKLSVHPSGRWRANMAYDAKDGYVVLFGGTDSGGTPLSDTWKFVANKWTDITSSVTGSPSPRYRFTMAYDAADKEVVTFGGCTTMVTNCADGSTWTYAAGAWSNITPGTSPSARVYSMMAYDAHLRALILFGGSPQATSLGTMQDTWKFSGGSWTNLTLTVGYHPPTRGYQVMAYDPLGSYVLLFGGISHPSSTSGYYSDSWAFGPNIVVWATAQPAAIDLTQSTAISVSTVTNQ